jgi:hypothetical protein
MTAPRDVESVVAQARSAQARILAPVDSSDTAIQVQSAQDRVVQELASQGLSFHISRDAGQFVRLVINWSSSTLVAGVGKIEDVAPKGPHPILLHITDGVRVRLEPRNLSNVPDWKRNDISNADYIRLVKGQTYEFRGSVRWCDCDGRSGLDLWVENRNGPLVDGDARNSCFIASVAYGHAHPSTATLRKYRDRILAERDIGRASVRLYYRASPWLVRVVSHTAHGRKLARALLSPIVWGAAWHLTQRDQRKPGSERSGPPTSRIPSDPTA